MRRCPRLQFYQLPLQLPLGRRAGCLERSLHSSTCYLSGKYFYQQISLVFATRSTFSTRPELHLQNCSEGSNKAAKNVRKDIESPIFSRVQNAVKSVDDVSKSLNCSTKGRRKREQKCNFSASTLLVEDKAPESTVNAARKGTKVRKKEDECNGSLVNDDSANLHAVKKGNRSRKKKERDPIESSAPEIADVDPVKKATKSSRRKKEQECNVPVTPANDGKAVKGSSLPSIEGLELAIRSAKKTFKANLGLKNEQPLLESVEESSSLPSFLGVELKIKSKGKAKSNSKESQVNSNSVKCLSQVSQGQDVKHLDSGAKRKSCATKKTSVDSKLNKSGLRKGSEVKKEVGSISTDSNSSTANIPFDQLVENVCVVSHDGSPDMVKNGIMKAMDIEHPLVGNMHLVPPVGTENKSSAAQSSGTSNEKMATSPVENMVRAGTTHDNSSTGASISSVVDTMGNIKVTRRFRKNPEEVVSLVKLNMCSKYGDLHGALNIYDKLKEERVTKLSVHNYSIFLYICSGAASGSLPVSKNGKKDADASTLNNKENTASVKPERSDTSEKQKDLVYFSPDDMELATRRGLEIYEDMLKANVSPTEAIFTSLARLAVAKGDGDMAFRIVKQMSVAGITPKLRSYGPALSCFCKTKNIEKAFEVDDHMVKAGILPDENMLHSLLKISADAGLDDKVYALLQRLRKTVRDVIPSTVETIQQWFKSEAAAFAGKVKWGKLPSTQEVRQAFLAKGGGWHGLGWLGSGKWQTKRTSINKAGMCLSCGEKLCTIDLDPVETDNFANSVAKLACQREQFPNQFKEFQAWLDKHGPYETILDGANIGLYNPQVYRGFNFRLLNAVAKSVRKSISTRRPPLILLHVRHATRLAKTSEDQAILNKWKSENSLYFTPQGSNDDWYWLYAAVKSKCLLVTNDEMRDHLFELLGTDFFPKWKERHQVRFTFSVKGLDLHMPPPYSTVIQESHNGSWHIPEVGGDDIGVCRQWLCVTRENSASL